MPRSRLFNLVLNLADTNIPCDACKPRCRDIHYIAVSPKQYDRKTKTLKHGARWIGFTVKAKTPKDELDAILEDAKRYQFRSQ